jgi:penicillin amidase
MTTDLIQTPVLLVHVGFWLLLFAILLLLTPATVYLWFRRSLPRITGTYTVSNLSAPVEIIRDSDGIPHIYATSKPDAWFGLGFVHAQDRLWQMDFQRRIGRGRVAELLGKRGVTFDLLARTMGFARVAAQTWDGLDSATREAIDAYSKGVNAFLAQCPKSRLAPEFFILRARPEPWTGQDTVLLSLLLAWNLAGNYPTELLRQRLCEAVGEVRCRELMPGYFDGVNQVHRIPMDGPIATSAHGFEPPGSFGEGAGSNLWAVGPAKTDTSGAVLANDPHLPSTNPMTWYLAHVCAPGLDAIGATTPGVPAVVLGRNRDICWGITNLNPDVQDFYRERLDETGLFAEFLGTFEPLQIVNETIRVRGGAPVSLRVRITRHGPLAQGIMGLSEEGSEPLAFRWTGLDPANTSLSAFLRLNEAHDWESFCAALRLCTSVPVNFGYADTHGNFGFHAAGKIPVRKSGDGSVPALGWTGENEWTGFIPFDELPHSFNPSGGYVVLINTAPPDPDYPHLLTTDWVEPYRLDRIHEFINDIGRMTTKHHAALQADTISLFARRALPMLLPLVSPGDASTRDAIEMLQQWDYDTAGHSGAAAIFCAWTLELPRALLRHELSADLLASYEAWPSWACRFMLDALTKKVRSDCEPEQAARAALQKALSTLRRKMGNNMRSWRWDSVHQAVFPHSPLNTRQWLRPFFSYSVAIGGDWSTVNLGGMVPSSPFDQRNIAGYRQIVDMSVPGGSFIHAGRQCGHFLARNFDYMRDWAAVSYRPMRVERAAVEQNATGALQLVPASRK